MEGSRDLRRLFRTVSLHLGCFLSVKRTVTVSNTVMCFPVCVGAEIDCKDKNGNTPLHIAARYGHELLINTLITNGAGTAK